MRAQEFITEVVSLKQPPPKTIWQRDVTDPGSYGPTAPKPEPVLIGSWADTDGTPVRNIFHPSPDGRSASLYFDRIGPDGKPTFDIIGTGGSKASGVLSGVVQNIKVYLKDHPNIKTINLHSEEPSRTRLYASIIDRLAPEMGWVGTATDIEPVIEYTRGSAKWTSGGSGDFTMTKSTSGQSHTPISPSVKSQLKIKEIPKISGPAEPSAPKGPGVSLERPAGYKQGGVDPAVVSTQQASLGLRVLNGISKALIPVAVATEIYRGYDQISGLSVMLSEDQYRAEVQKIVGKLIAEFGLTWVAAIGGAWIAGALGATAAGVGAIPAALAGFVAGGAAAFTANYFLGDSLGAIVNKIVEEKYKKPAANTQGAVPGGTGTPSRLGRTPSLNEHLDRIVHLACN
jgi:hypothetical protein